MHELSIMQSAIETALGRAQENGANRICELRLQVGALSGVVPEALLFAFEALTPGTLLEGGTLRIEHVPARFHCGTCARDFESESMLADCPTCGAISRDLRAGRELQILAMEIE
jgi:hydrogenase nickel incorporation protein HypA/HybF